VAVVPPALYARRLGGAYGRDSSAAALTRALERPLDGLETDCCLTADDDLVLLHDPLHERVDALAERVEVRPDREAAQLAGNQVPGVTVTPGWWATPANATGSRDVRWQAWPTSSPPASAMESRL
jgi:glycerophosphoryl diester phosphodiesterase